MRTPGSIGVVRPASIGLTSSPGSRPLAPTTVANLTAPLLEIVANGLSAENLPETLICSGLLTTEYDRVLAAFGPHGSVETGCGAIGDWGSLVFARRRFAVTVLDPAGSACSTQG